MGLLGYAIVSACVVSTTATMSEDACEKAAEAGSKQSGIYQRMNTYEDKTVKQFTKDAQEALGKDVAWSVAGTAFLIKTATTRAVVFGLPTYGICSSLKTEIKPDKSLLIFEWKF